jgi:hypothetical protein
LIINLLAWNIDNGICFILQEVAAPDIR